MFERLICHHGAEVGAADADVDNVANAFSSMTFPLAAADTIGKVGHLIEDGMNFRHYVFAVDDDRCSPACAEGHMQCGAIFRDVDFLAAKHRFDPGAQVGLHSERDHQSEGLVVYAIFGIVQEDAGSFRRHPLRTRGIVCEKCPQVAVSHRPLVILERAPRRSLASRLRPRYLQVCSHLRTSLAQPGGRDAAAG